MVLFDAALQQSEIVAVAFDNATDAMLGFRSGEMLAFAFGSDTVSIVHFGDRGFVMRCGVTRDRPSPDTRIE